MSDRPNWFRFVIAIFVFVFAITAIVILPVNAQDLAAAHQSTVGERVGSDGQGKGDVIEELFPYASSSDLMGGQSDLINGATYPFATLGGVALEDMSAGTTQLLGASQDDTASSLANIGFDVWLDGVRFTQFSVNPNGLLKLGSPVVNNGANGRTNNLATANDLPKIAPYWDDLCTSATGKVHYKVVGSPGSRRLVVEWQNLVTFGTSCTTGLTIGTFQAWVYESTGVIQFVYGALGANSATNGGYSIGIGSAAASFASVTSGTDTASYAASDNAQTGAIAAGKSYTFTPVVPAAPTSLPVSPITQTSLNLNWLDNATTEVGYAIYRSTDNVNFSFLTQTAVNAVSFDDTGLLPGTQYFYRIIAVSEGAQSAAATASATTSPAGNISCNGAGGNWSSTSTWVGGVVPGGGDNVTIGSGCTVTVDTAATSLAMAVQSGGILEFESVTARTLNVVMGMVIGGGGIVRTPEAGTVTTHQLAIGSDLANNGTLDLSTNANTAGAELRFNGATNNSYTGTGTNDLRQLTVNKGSGTVNSGSPTLDVNVSNMTVRGAASGGTVGFINTATFNGILKLSGTNSLSDTFFTPAAYSIPATGGFWLNNANATITGQNGSPTLSGLLRISNGTYNIGTSSGNSMGFATGSTIVVDGGAVNAAGRFGVSAATSVINYTQSAGTITVQTVGNTSTTLAGFDVGTSLTSSISITGGTIVVQINNTAVSGPRDYRHQAGNGITGVTGGTLQLGNAASGAAKTFFMRGVVPNLVVDNTSAGHTGNWDVTLTNYNNICRNVTVMPGTTLNPGNVIWLFSGTTLTNNGTFTHNGASSRTYFFGAGALAPQTFTGSGTITAPLTSIDFDNTLGVTLDASLPTVNTNRVILFAGNITNASKLTVGSGGATAATVQIGNTTTPTDAGLFDSAPGFNAGTGGNVISYLRTVNARSTGPEVPGSRTYQNFTYNDNDPMHALTVAGGNLTVNGTLTLTEGVIATGANKITHGGTATRTNGYVNGTLERSFAATGAYTFHVGQNGYSPVAASVTAGMFPASLSVKPTDSTLAGLNPSTAVSRYWTLTETGDLTSDLGFTYLDADISGNEADYRLFKLAAGVLTNMCMGGPCVNAGTNTASLTGVSDFSDWGIGENGSGTPGALEFSSATYSGGENTGSVTVTVNRTGGSANTVTVDYASVVGGTATGGASCTPGVDYVNASGTLTFLNGETSKTFNVTLCDDVAFEPDETVNLSLTNPTGGGTIGTQGTAVLTILNDDASASPVTVTATAGTTGPTPYNTVKEAFDAINAGTHQGVINVLVNQNTTETATAALNASGSGSASYSSVTMRPTATVTVSGSITGAIIRLNGADNVTIDGRIGGTGSGRDLSVINNQSSAATAAIWLSSAGAGAGASNNVIRNLELACGANQSTGALASFGIFMGGATIAVGSNGDDNDSNSFIANRIIKARYGIATRGNPANLNLNTVVTDNIIGPAAFGADQIGKVGIFMQADDGATIGRNTIQFVGGAFANTTAGADRIGIALGVESWGSAPTTLAGANYNVTRNVIHDVIEERTFSAVGILQASANGANPTSNLIANNFIYNVNANGTVGDTAIGIGIASGNNDRVVFNSVRMAGDSDPSAGAATPTQNPMNLRVANTPANLTVKNNSLYNDVFSSSAPTLQSANIQLPTATFAFGTGGLNNNNYYFPVSNTTARTGAIGTTSVPTAFHQTLANWQAAVTPQDANSIQADPQYVSATDLHIALGSPNVNAGATGTGITVDIDFQARDAMPDIGADEPNGATPPANDIAAVAIVNPVPGANLVIGNTATPQAKFYNAGSVTQTGVMVRFTITGPGGYNYSDIKSITSIDPDAVTTVTFATTSPFTTAGAYVTTATVLTSDSNPSNDSVTAGFTVLAPINGTVTVGTGGQFTSLTNPGGLFDSINLAGVSGNITADITSDLSGETGAVLLNEFASPFTLTIKPSGAARTVSGISSATGGLLGFNGADRVTIDGSLSGGTDRSLTIQSNNTATTGAAIYFATGTNGAQNNTIKNANVWGLGATTGSLLGIAFANNTFGAVGADHDNNRIENNDIRGTFYGIGMLGLSAANPNVGNVITKNVMPATGAAGIGRIGMYIFSEDGIQVTENTIASVSSGTAIDCIGIAGGNQNITLTPVTGDITNAVIARNNIGVVSNTITNSSVGIVLASGTTGTNTVVNNMVSGVIGNSDATDLTAGILVIPRAGATQNIYHNSVSMSGDRGTTVNQTPSYALAITADLPVNVVNNILTNSQTRTGATGGGGESYAIAFDGPAANVNLMSNYNDLFVSGPLGQVGITGDLTTPAQTTTAGTGSNRTTLADWQTATSEDANSLSVNPLFTSLTDLHLMAGSPMINAGTNVGVTTDFDGQTRVPPVEIGADELPGAVVPGSLQFSSATYSVGEAGGTVTLTVTRTGGSGGVVGVNYATANGTATGGASCTAGIDYVNANGTLNWGDGDSASKTFNVTICNDATFEPDETFTATLSGATGGATIGTPNPATVTITNDDPPPAGQFSINDVRLFEGNSGAVNAVFAVTFNGAGAASVQYSTANGTAIAGTDFLPASGTLNFNSSFEPEGGVPTSTQTITVVVNGEVVKEANETFFVNLSAPTGGTIADGQGVGIIVDEDRAYVADFDRDLSSDASVYRPSDGKWYVLRSASASAQVVTFGLATDVAVPGDYDGDGLADFGIWRPSTGQWFRILSASSSTVITSWGSTGDKPVQGDYDGDGKTDLAIYRPSTGTWWILRSSNGTSTAIPFGISADRPMQGDYDGDAKTDLAVYRDGTWYVMQSSDSSVSIRNWGLASDKPVSGDFDGDGKYDLAIFRSGVWWISNSLTGSTSIVALGAATDIPAPADYDGDGTTDKATFRPSNGDWYILRSSNGTVMGPHWGVSGDVPVPSAYVPQ